VLFSPDGKTFASKAGESRLWDVATHRQTATLPGPTQHGWALAFSPDGKILASSDINVVELFDVVTKRKLASLPGHRSDTVEDLAFSPDGRILASAGFDQTIRLWDPGTSRPLGTMKGYAGVVSRIAFSPDGNSLAAACADNTITLWDVATQQKVATLRGHTRPVYAVAFSSDGNTLASGSGDATIRLWRAPPLPATDPVRVLSTSGSDGAVTLQWQPLPWALGYNVYRRSGNRGRQGTSTSTSRSRTPERRNAWMKLTPRPVMETSFTDGSSGLVNGQTDTYAVAALFRGAAGRVTEGPRVTRQASPVSVPPGWIGSSINEEDRCGSVLFDAGTMDITLRGSGHDIGGEVDGFYFLNQPVTGDFQITVTTRNWPTGTNDGAQAGLMVRESLEAGARHVLLDATTGHGIQYKWRAFTHNATGSEDEIPATALKLAHPGSARLRLRRKGNMMIPEYSRDDGQSFQAAGMPLTMVPPLAKTVYVGLAITAHDESEISEAKFSHLVIRKQ
jgi:WD40 domain-containing protein